MEGMEADLVNFTNGIVVDTRRREVIRALRKRMGDVWSTGNYIMKLLGFRTESEEDCLSLENVTIVDNKVTLRVGVMKDCNDRVAEGSIVIYVSNGRVEWEASVEKPYKIVSGPSKIRIKRHIREAVGEMIEIWKMVDINGRTVLYEGEHLEYYGVDDIATLKTLRERLLKEGVVNATVVLIPGRKKGEESLKLMLLW